MPSSSGGSERESAPPTPRSSGATRTGWSPPAGGGCALARRPDGPRPDPDAHGLPQIPDAELVRRFREGDRAAYAEIVRRYQDRVFTLCLRWMGDRELAEDVAQDVFLALFKSLPSFRGDSQLSTWVFRVVINHCKNRRLYRKRRHSDQHESLEGERDDELP